MKDRLHAIIEYATGGTKSEFAAMMGWSPQYLSKLLKGVDLGLTPVKTIIEKLPEINARWLITGDGQMLSYDAIFTRLNGLHQSEIKEIIKIITSCNPTTQLK